MGPSHGEFPWGFPMGSPRGNPMGIPLGPSHGESPWGFPMGAKIDLNLTYFYKHRPKLQMPQKNTKTCQQVNKV